VAGNQIDANSKTNFNTVAGYTQIDIGSPGISGSVTSSGGGFDVTAAGNDIGGNSDQFTFGYQQRSGDFDVKVRLQGLDLTDPWSKAGLMARQSLNANSTHAAALATPSVSGCFFEARPILGWNLCLGQRAGELPRYWLRLKRTGSNFFGFASFDGSTWVQLGSVTMNMSDPFYFGLAVSSHTNAAATTAQFRNIGSPINPTLVNSLAPTSEPLGPSTRKTGLVISEIMYHPRDPATNGEFVEIFNSQAFWEILAATGSLAMSTSPFHPTR